MKDGEIGAWIAVVQVVIGVIVMIVLYWPPWEGW